MARARLGFATLLGSTALAAFIFLIARYRASASTTLSAVPFAMLVSLPFALAAAATGTVSRSGAVAGLLVSSALLAGAGWPAWLQLGVVLIVAAGATRAGRARNARGGLLDDRNGRGWRSVTANTTIAACAALYAHDPGVRDLAALVVASVLIAGAGDTVASEIGKAFGGRVAFSLIPVRRVPPGTPGAVSLVGTLAGIGSAVAMAVCAGGTGLVRIPDIAVVTIAAVVAILLDSLMAGVLESGGWLDNDGVNLLATCAAAIAATGLRGLWP